MTASEARTGGGPVRPTQAGRGPAPSLRMPSLRMPSLRVVCLLALAGLATASLAGEAVAPGEYIADGGRGRLSIAPAEGKGADQASAFTLDAVGANFHVCGLEGRIVHGRATLETDDDTTACVVDFAPVEGGVEVIATVECRYFCGARAQFAGTYLRPAAGCGDAERQATRATFTRLYDGKRHAEALATLSPLATRCARTLDRYEEGRILNDIAITQYRLGQRAECLRTLAPFAEEAAQPDEAILRGYPPSDGQAWLPIVQAARFNLGLCRRQPR